MLASMNFLTTFFNPKNKKVGLDYFFFGFHDWSLIFLISVDTNVTSPNIIEDNESEKLIRNVVYLKISSFEDQIWAILF